VKFLKNIFTGLFISFALLTLIEIPFRIYDYGFKYRHLRSKISKGEVDIPFDEIQIYAFKTGQCLRDPNLIWRYKKIIGSQLYQLNSLGLRTTDGKRLERSKDKHVYRIIVFGGSHPFGLGVSYEQTYAQQLEELFKRERHKWSKTVEVINAAVPGYSTLQVLNLLKYHMVDYEPDLVIIDAGNNDGIPLTPDYPWKDSQMVKKNPFICQVLNLVQRSSFFWYYRLFINKIVNLNDSYKNIDSPGRITRLSKEENRQNLEQMKELAHKDNFKIVFLSQMLYNAGKLERGFGERVEPYIDIYAQLREKQNISEYFIDSIHASAKGHKEIARIIYNFLTFHPEYAPLRE
jgi:lysophospholipase L1-like esterase